MYIALLTKTLRLHFFFQFYLLIYTNFSIERYQVRMRNKTKNATDKIDVHRIDILYIFFKSLTDMDGFFLVLEFNIISGFIQRVSIFTE